MLRIHGDDDEEDDIADGSPAGRTVRMRMTAGGDDSGGDEAGDDEAMDDDDHPHAYDRHEYNYDDADYDDCGDTASLA